MTNTITIRISNAVQRAALLAGESATRDQSYDVPAAELPRLLALPWTRVDAAGVATCDVPAGLALCDYTIDGEFSVVRHVRDARYNRDSIEHSVADARPATAAEAIDFAEGLLVRFAAELAERRETKRSQAEERATISRSKAERWAALPVAYRANARNVLRCAPTSNADHVGPLCDSGHPMVELSELVEYAPGALAEAQAESKRLAQELVDAAAALEREHSTALAALVQEHGSPDQAERYTAGMLPTKELRKLVNDVLFAELADVPRYGPITERNVVEHCSCDGDDVRFSSSELENPELDADEFAQLKLVRELAPEGATVEVREHEGYSNNAADGEAGKIVRLGIRVTVEFAGADRSREYAL